jgi:hypothetical protein
MVPKVLLLTRVVPAPTLVEHLFVRDLCMLYPHDRLCCFHVATHSQDLQYPEMAWLPTQSRGYREYNIRYNRLRTTFSRRIWQRLLPFGLNKSIPEYMGAFIELYREYTELGDVIQAATKFGKTQKVDLLWAVLDSPTIVRMAKVVADSLKIPVVTTIWDPPRYQMEKWEPDNYTLRRLLRIFDDTARSVSRCGVASEGMKHAFYQKYDVPCVVMTYAPGIKQSSIDDSLTHDDKQIVIGYAGRIYATREWNALLTALAHNNWKIANRKVKLQVLSKSIQGSYDIPLHIDFLGWRDPVETVRLLSETDVAYLPYWFDETYQEVVQHSFPSKLATYIAAKVPVLFHGPANASPAVFFSKFPVGLGCHSLDSNEIIHVLERLTTDGKLRKQAQLACADAWKQELSPFVFRTRFAELMGVDEDELLPYGFSQT